MFDWQNFLDQHNIPYTDRGRNVSKGNLAIHCPLCGEADPSMHLNVSLRGYGWACWRDAEHRSKNNAKLVQTLLRISYAEALKIVGGDGPVPTDEDFGTQVGRLLGSVALSEPKVLKLPTAWRPLAEPGGVFRNIVLEYIKDRGYTEYDALRLCNRYEIYYAITGSWRQRVLWPLRNERGELVNYTGRTIGRSTVRYKTLSAEYAKARISHCLFDLHNLFKRKGNVLVVCEGPFDAMRIGWIGEPFGIHATCIFTQNVSDTQASLLTRLQENYERQFILFDRAAAFQSLRAQALLGSSCQRITVPEGVKDPGELSAGQCLTLCRSLLAA